MSIPMTCLVILDGFGANPNLTGNAVLNTPTPNLDFLWQNYPHTLLKAAEEEVGLSFGEMGNSEVGHLTIGSGRVLYQSLPRIDLSIQQGNFFENPRLLEAAKFVRDNNSSLHLIGMISVAGVHAHIDHLLALLDFAKRQGLKSVFVHPILDGRDSGPKDAMLYIKVLEEGINKYQTGQIASVGGRAYAMDRNKNFEKTAAYYNALFGINSPTGQDVKTIVQEAYNQGLDDENVIPTVITKDGQPLGAIKANDAIIFTNYREDRARQLTQSLCLDSFKGFQRAIRPQNLMVVTMTEYEKGLPVRVILEPEQPVNTLSECLEKNNISQVHLAETEKYAHVTYFFNGGREYNLPHETFFKVPSPKPETFEAHPEMAAYQVLTQALIIINGKSTNFLIINFANADMIGHTGNYEAIRKAVSIIDDCVGKIWQAIAAQNGWLFITSDHGNAEAKIDMTSFGLLKDHTTAPVPFIAANPTKPSPEKNSERVTLGSPVTGLLTDISPSILSLLGLPIPEEMTGTPLFI